MPPPPSKNPSDEVLTHWGAHPRAETSELSELFHRNKESERKKNTQHVDFLVALPCAPFIVQQISPAFPPSGQLCRRPPDKISGHTHTVHLQPSLSMPLPGSSLRRAGKLYSRFMYDRIRRPCCGLALRDCPSRIVINQCLGRDRRHSFPVLGNAPFFSLSPMNPPSSNFSSFLFILSSRGAPGAF